MKIAQIAPLAESCPPRLYGGTERIVSYLTEELVRQGHEVTLFASGDSVTSAELVPCSKMALRLDHSVKDMTPYHVMMLDQVARRADEFDVLHFHIDHLHCPLMRPYADRILTTLHGRFDLPDLMSFYSAFPEPPLVSISDAQRRPMPPVNWLGTVLHGLPNNVLPYRNPPPGDYLAFLGRISPEKGPDKVIEIATRAGVPLRMAAKIDAADQRYWDQVIAPMVAAHPRVEFVGEINEVQKAEFLGNARALLFPICWPEPFGLVMIEAMACGMPVIALAHGSVPEVIDHGVSGFVVNSVDEAVEAAKSIGTLDRQMIRKRFEERFTAERMARDYLAAYRRLPALRQKAQLDVFAIPSCDGVIRMPPPAAGLELGVPTAG
ncbi:MULTISPECIES: glycosyltransferase family 4 protein [unclassified Bradyrhizobium]|uniref:glycosyltransferase family 4 protein n=1 Tax=unclassified Bradyrhizobium TaxID=2631580 RepID=UPI0020B212D7|nr:MULTISPECIES: glycosyltransferase family 4 protein [unclassified Bradyrhizobium]MCP3402053.1 glycosyltransferase family 4 protein [Bradyrhizobium sp. CCGB20]MCP3410540.1 glycosyltransferase family 4 protein [Bradyrhizobium sp. CCGB01]